MTGTAAGGLAPTPQPAIPGVPPVGTTPQPYIEAATARVRLTAFYGFTATALRPGHLLAASMRLDEEGPFLGIKYVIEQERQWPRSFKYGWPNTLATPSPVMVATEFPGAWYLNYEGVVPQQVVDWVCLEAYRITIQPVDRQSESESISGASIKYAPPIGYVGGQATQIDDLQAGLLSPFLIRVAHTEAFLSYKGMI